MNQSKKNFIFLDETQRINKYLRKYLKEVYSGDAYQRLAVYAQGDQKQELESMGATRNKRLARVEKLAQQAEREAAYGTGIGGMVRRLLGRGINPHQLDDVVGGAPSPSIGDTSSFDRAQKLSQTELSQRSLAWIRANRARHLLGQVSDSEYENATADPVTGRIHLRPSPRVSSNPLRTVGREIKLRADQGLPVARITATDGVPIKQEVPTANWATGGMIWIDKIQERAVAAKQAAKRERELAKMAKEYAKRERKQGKK